MTFREGKQVIEPLYVFPVNGSYYLGVYQGTLSKFDILIRYRQLENKKWSRLRTPSHVHWVVDILIKLHIQPVQTKEFLDFLLNLWHSTTSIKSKTEQEKALCLGNLLNVEVVQKYEGLGQNGEYSIKFLILLAKLLMIQEKTNREDAYMFKDILEKLKSGPSIFQAISKAQLKGRK